MTPLEREELTAKMVRLADGDRSAFDPIFEATWPLVHRFAIKILGTNHDAEDVAQYALMKVFNRAQEFRPDGDALSWILGITAYECKTSLQKTKRRREDLGNENALDIADDPSPNAEENLVNRHIFDAIEELLKELSAKERETILIAIHDLQKPEISAATFRKRLQRALDRLREKWSDKYE